MLYLELIVTGIGFGAMYGLAGMGFNLIYSTTRVFDIGIGATYLVGAYLFYMLTRQDGVPWAVAVPLAIAAGVICELVFYEGVYRFVERKSIGSFFGYFVASFGILTVAQNLLQMRFGASSVFVGSGLIQQVKLRGFSIDRGVYLAILVAAVCYLVLQLVVSRSGAGVRFRALAENVGLLRTIGLPSERYRLLAFGLGGAMVVVAALVLVSLQGLSPTDGFTQANLAVAAMLVGGLGRFGGSLLGGIVLGVAENLSLAWINGGWTDAIAFGVLLLVILIRPEGMLNRA